MKQSCRHLVSVCLRLKTKSEKSTRLGNTGLVGELEHLKIETRLMIVNRRDVSECDG